MDPLKIAVRMFSVLISEPMIITCDTVNTILLGITGKYYFSDLKYCFDKEVVEASTYVAQSLQVLST